MQLIRSLFNNDVNLSLTIFNAWPFPLSFGFGFERHPITLLRYENKGINVNIKKVQIERNNLQLPLRRYRKKC